MRSVPGLVSMLGLVATPFALAACGARPSDSSSPKEAWNLANDPIHLSDHFNRNLAQLPTEAHLAVDPWSDTYWPSFLAGTAARWRHPAHDNFTYVPFKLDQLKTMSARDLSHLSPAEKYDAFIQHYDYPLVASERTRTSPNAASWEGLCHGWAPASLAFSEPKPVLMTNADGVAIPFAASDIKALLTLMQGQYPGTTQASDLGERCNFDLSAQPDAATRPECRDTNAGAFHIALVNQLGVFGHGLVADVTRDIQVWNQPINGFKSTVLRQQAPSPGAAAGTVRETVLDTTIYFGEEIDPRWDAVVGTPQNANRSRTYEYRVELDASGNIIGGDWEGQDRPDFLWTMPAVAFQDYFGPLKTIYDASLAGSPLPDPDL